MFLWHWILRLNFVVIQLSVLVWLVLQLLVAHHVLDYSYPALTLALDRVLLRILPWFERTRFSYTDPIFCAFLTTHNMWLIYNILQSTLDQQIGKYLLFFFLVEFIIVNHSSLAIDYLKNCVRCTCMWNLSVYFQIFIELCGHFFWIVRFYIQAIEHWIKLKMKVSISTNHEQINDCQPWRIDRAQNLQMANG